MGTAVTNVLGKVYHGKVINRNDEEYVRVCFECVCVCLDEIINKHA